MKKAIGLFFAVGLLGVGIYFYLENAGQVQETADSFVKPELELATIQVKSIEDEVITLQLSALMHNKMPVSYGVDTLQYNVYLEGVLVAESTYPKGISVAANDNSRINLPVSIYQDKINQVLQRVEQNRANDSIRINMKADLYTDLPLAPDPVELSISKLFYFVRQPQISVSNVRVDKFGFDQSEVEMLILVDNPNQFSFSFRQTDYEFRVDNERIAKGAIRKATNIVAQDSTTFIIPFQVNLDKVGENAFNLLFQPKSTGYNFSLSTRIDADNEVINDARIRISMSGKLEDLMQ